MIRKKAASKAASTTAPGIRRAGGPGDEAASRDPALSRVRELARIAAEFDLAEVELEPAGRIRLARRVSGGSYAPTAVPAAPPSLGLSPVTGVAAAVEAADDGSVFVTSPFVGTFYRSPSPEANSFVELGQSVRKGQVVCIIEAMKLMNEIESESDGKVAEVMAKNGEHVEYGQKLFRLTKA